MISIISIFCCLAGFCIFYRSAWGVYIQTASLSEDVLTWPDDFRPSQTLGTRILAVNAVVRLVCSIAVLIAGVCSLANSTSSYIARTAVLLAGLVLCAWTLLSVIITGRLKMKDTMNEIESQWKREKRISVRHDDEVRLYRVLKEAVGIASNNIFLMILLIIGYFIS